jgi:hypothetical protein
MLKKYETYQHRSEHRNGPNGAEEYCPITATPRPLEKVHPSRACCRAPRECRLLLECDEILFCREAILALNSEGASSSLKDDDHDEVNEAIQLGLSDESFSSVSSVREIARWICVLKSWVNCISSDCRFSAFHAQSSDIFIGFLASSSTARRHGKSSRVESSRVESSRVVDPTSRPPVVHPASRIGWGYILTLDEAWFYLLTDQIMR